MVAVVQVWLGFLCLFEAVAVTRFCLGESAAEVQPMHRAGSSTTDLDAYWLLVVAFLVIVRAAQAASPASKPLWRVTAAIHVTEAVFYTWWVFVHHQTLPTDPEVFNMPTHGGALVVYGGVVVNAVWFTLMAVTTPAVKPKAA